MTQNKYMKVHSVPPLTDKELDRIISAPRPFIERSMQTNVTLYKCYVADGFWKGMDKHRMLVLFDRMMKVEARYLNPFEIAKAKKIMAEIQKQINESSNPV